MTCEYCDKGEMEATEAPRVSERVLKIGYAVTVGAALILGAGVGVVLALAGDGGVDLSWALIVAPVILLLCTPIVFIGVSQRSWEKNIWQCTNCGYSFDRA